MLTESRRKWLTEYIGECWHEWTYIRGSLRQELWQCSKCGEACKDVASEDQKNRTFLTWADLGVVKEAIEKAGRWSQFEDFTFWEWQKIPLTEMTTHMQWLIDPARFCDLAGEWLKQKG